jgi:hypothetical protein
MTRYIYRNSESEYMAGIHLMSIYKKEESNAKFWFIFSYGIPVIALI